MPQFKPGPFYDLSGYLSLMQSGALKVDWESGEVTMDQNEAMEMVACLAQLKMDWIKVNQNRDIRSSLYSDNFGSEPHEYADNCSGWLVNGISLVQMEETMEEMRVQTGQVIIPVWIPQSGKPGGVYRQSQRIWRSAERVYQC